MAAWPPKRWWRTWWSANSVTLCRSIVMLRATFAIRCCTADYVAETLAVRMIGRVFRRNVGNIILRTASHDTIPTSATRRRDHVRISSYAQSSAIARYRSAPLLEERIRDPVHCKQIGIKLETLRKIASHQLSLVFLPSICGTAMTTASTYESLKAWSLPEARKLQPRARRLATSTMPTDGCTFWAGFMFCEPMSCPYTRGHSLHGTCIPGECGAGQMPQSKAVVEQSIASSFGWMEMGVDLASIEITMIDQIIANYCARG